MLKTLACLHGHSRIDVRHCNEDASCITHVLYYRYTCRIAVTRVVLRLHVLYYGYTCCITVIRACITVTCVLLLLYVLYYGYTCCITVARAVLRLHVLSQVMHKLPTFGMVTWSGFTLPLYSLIYSY